MINKSVIVLIVLFLIIKANPYYYICQNMPATGRVIENSIDISKHDNQQAFLIKFDKSITESINDQNVPDIKFTGIPFVFFFFSLFLIFSTLKTGLPIKYPVFQNEGCIRLCILRL
ncbi:MAG: hypothetical protein JST50_13300 [Bacteroidetes bacterium]|nr:hypothetical protein [Bacteroidota bacterium]